MKKEETTVMSEEITENADSIKVNDAKAKRLEKKAEKIKKHKEKKQRTPEEKKKRRRIVIGVIVAVIVLWIVISNIIAANTPPVVYTTAATKGDIVQSIDASGPIKSLDKAVVYAPVEGKVGDVNVAVGDFVTEGTVLFTYDEETLNKSIETTTLKKSATDGGYNKSIESNNRVVSKLSEALTNLPVLDEQIPFAENYIDELEKKIEDKKAALSYEGAMLNVSLLDYSPYDEEYVELQKRIQENAYEQQHNKELRDMQEELEDANKILNDLKTLKSEMKSQKSGSQDSTMTKGAKEELEANYEMSVAEIEETLEAYEDVKGGVTAEFDGVVTKLNTIKGAPISKSTELVTIESMENVVVEIKLTKFDLETLSEGMEAAVTINGKDYTGKLSHINKMAETNQSGSTVVGAQIKLDNPDDNIVLGIDGKAQIKVGEAKDAILVANELVNYDVDGAFVNMVIDGIVTKVHVTIGLSDDVNTQILEGVSEGDQIIAELPDMVTEGMTVTAIAQ